MKSGDGAAAMGSLKAYQDKLGSEKPQPMFYAFFRSGCGTRGGTWAAPWRSAKKGSGTIRWTGRSS